MAIARLERLRWRLGNRLPLIGGWLRRRAVRALSKEGSAEAARVLAEVRIDCTHPDLCALLDDALAGITLPSGRDAVAAVWARTRDAALAEHLQGWGHVATGPPAARVLTALLLGRSEVLEESPEELRALLALAEAEDLLAPVARARLLEVRSLEGRDALAEEWVRSRNGLLWEALTRTGYLPRNGAARLLVLLKRGEVGEVIGVEMVAPLLGAAGDRDPDIAGRARRVLRELVDPGAREELCRCFLATGDAEAERAVRQGNMLPEEPQARALLLFLLGRWEECEALDFDRRLLRSAYAAAPADLRRRMAERARREGRAELVEAWAGRGAGALSDEEWAHTLELLGGVGAWEKLWRLAEVASPGWAARILRRLPEGWKPGGEDPGEVVRLRQLAGRWDESALGPAEFCRDAWDTEAGPVECLALDPEGRWLASAHRGNSEVLLWDLRTEGASPRRESLRGHSAPVRCVAFSPVRDVLASAGDDQSVRLWRVPDWRCRALQGCTGPITALAITPDGQTVVSLGQDFVQVWDRKEEDPEGKPRDQPSRPLCLAVSPDGEVLATGNADGSVCLSWHLPDCELKVNLEEHAAAVIDVAFSADGRLVASADRTGQVRLWQVAGGKCVAHFPGRSVPLTHPPFVADRRIPTGRVGARKTLWPMPDGRLLAARARRRTLRLWTPADGRVLATLRGHARGITSLAAHARGILVTGDAGGEVRVWGVPTRLARLGRKPIPRMKLADWEWARSRLEEPGPSPGERNALLFLEALLRRRWRASVRVEESGGPRQDHDIGLGP
jgi:WD40 repeat protein